MTLNMQVKQYGNAVALLDGMLLREQELVEKVEAVNREKSEEKPEEKSEGKSEGKKRRRGEKERAYRETVDSEEVDEQETLTSDHVNDYIHVLYRMELLGEGMGDRWPQVLDLLRRTHKRFLTPMDTVYRSLLFSVTGEEAMLQAMLSGDAAREQDSLWQELQLRSGALLL